MGDYADASWVSLPSCGATASSLAISDCGAGGV